jgi:hypothetical protein
MNIEQIKKYEQDLKDIGCVLIESKIMASNFERAYIPNRENFIELLRIMQGKIVIFVEHQMPESVWYYVIFHGLAFYTSTWEPTVNQKEKAKT